MRALPRKNRSPLAPGDGYSGTTMVLVYLRETWHFFGSAESAVSRREAWTLGEPILDHFSSHVGEPEIPALKTIGQRFVIEPETMQHGGV